MTEEQKRHDLMVDILRGMQRDLADLKADVSNMRRDSEALRTQMNGPQGTLQANFPAVFQEINSLAGLLGQVETLQRRVVDMLQIADPSRITQK